jgi:C4-dicarboxylate-specific signal transduction histidine kinase
MFEISMNNNKPVKIKMKVKQNALKISFSEGEIITGARSFERVFEPLFTAKSAKEINLQLSMCSCIIRENEGKLFVVESYNSCSFDMEFSITQTEIPEYKFFR